MMRAWQVVGAGHPSDVLRQVEVPVPVPGRRESESLMHFSVAATTPSRRHSRSFRVKKFAEKSLLLVMECRCGPVSGTWASPTSLMVVEDSRNSRSQRNQRSFACPRACLHLRRRRFESATPPLSLVCNDGVNCSQVRPSSCWEQVEDRGSPQCRWHPHLGHELLLLSLGRRRHLYVDWRAPLK